MNSIQSQAAKLWQLLFESDTGATYQKALRLTWEIIKETALLIWLVLCLGLVGITGTWDLAVKSVADLQGWVKQLDEPTPQKIAAEVASGVSEKLKWVSSSGLSQAVSSAKQQLGLPDTPTAADKAPAATSQGVAETSPVTETKSKPKAEVVAEAKPKAETES
ncbi:MAG: hypothetical protein F6K19_11650 [Cyanothece sp. SIO1E1]|nr:hypothetical protein [Cyanothece sp. SIO1E1]